jgi:hypothetical protein
MPAPGYRFVRPSVSELTIELATERASIRPPTRLGAISSAET